MAKGRRLTISRSERLLGSYGYGQGQGTGSDASELAEEDVWSLVDDMVNGDGGSINGEWSARTTPESDGSGSSGSRRSVPRSGTHVGGLSLAFDDSDGGAASCRILHQFRGVQDNVSTPRGHRMATSAPVNVPDWSNIFRVNSVESLHESDEDRESGVVPPHEYLAREYARRTAANSVFEGVGRTLKGRDMSRVRDAVWSQTGFDG